MIKDIPATDRATEVDLEKKEFPITKTLGEIKKYIRRVSPMNPHPPQNGCFPIFPLYDLTGLRRRIWRKLSTFNCNGSYRGLPSAAQISEIELQLNLELINLSE